MQLRASLFLSPYAAMLWCAARSEVLSTIDSVILSPSPVLAQNVLASHSPRIGLLS